MDDDWTRLSGRALSSPRLEISRVEQSSPRKRVLIIHACTITLKNMSPVNTRNDIATLKEDRHMSSCINYAGRSGVRRRPFDLSLSCACACALTLQRLITREMSRRGGSSRCESFNSAACHVTYMVKERKKEIKKRSCSSFSRLPWFLRTRQVGSCLASGRPRKGKKGRLPPSMKIQNSSAAHGVGSFVSV